MNAVCPLHGAPTRVIGVSAKRFDAVVFDFGGVLITPITNKVQRVAERAGVEVETMLAVLMGPRHESGDHPWHRAERGEMRVADIQGLLGPYAAAAGVELVGDEVDVLLDATTYDKNMVLIERIESLRSEGYRTGLLTNSFAEFRPTLAKDLDLTMFDVFVDSSEVGSRKPEPSVYATTTSRFGVHPSRIVYLDDFVQNIIGAEREGWHTIHVTSPVAARTELDALLTA